MPIFIVKVLASTGEQDLSEVSSGTFEPGANAPLRLHGEILPEFVIRDIGAADPSGTEGATVNLQYGDARYQVSFVPETSTQV